jgi:cardiolipin synthase
VSRLPDPDRPADGAHPLPSTGEWLSEQMLARAAGSEAIAGNAVRLLKDAAENYPAWLEAIAAARHTIHFENYIIADDATGRMFAAALAARARAGVAVRVIYDWMGALGVGSARVLREVAAAGGEVRCFNPPRPGSPFGWLARDHRKLLVVDGETGFVSGLCVSRKWEGDALKAVTPWRDTGVMVRGPAVAAMDEAFVRLWSHIGAPTAAVQPPAAVAGDSPVRVLVSEPNAGRLFQIDQLVASMASETLWLSDAYYVALAPYAQALRAAARDGVDVRLLVPGNSDVPWLAGLSRAGYRPLLEAGVRVFEWNGSMMHAKTAVADCRWTRIGSTNLNVASWIGNYELDVAIEDEKFACAMQAMFEADLANATEVVLDNLPRRHQPRQRLRRGSGVPSRAAAGALRFGNTLRAAMRNRRLLGPAESAVMAVTGGGFLLLALCAIFLPWLLILPVAVAAGWVGLVMLLRAWRAWRSGKSKNNN